MLSKGNRVAQRFAACQRGVANAYDLPYALGMTSITASEARNRLYRLVDETAAAHQPILITGKRANAVMLSEADWNAIQETLYLLSAPGMRESIQAGLATPVDECATEPGW